MGLFSDSPQPEETPSRARQEVPLGGASREGHIPGASPGEGVTSLVLPDPPPLCAGPEAAAGPSLKVRGSPLGPTPGGGVCLSPARPQSFAG
ncbi:hypothetical protein lerEdw1_015805, partial [Lerista edwardsae]